MFSCRKCFVFKILKPTIPMGHTKAKVGIFSLVLLYDNQDYCRFKISVWSLGFSTMALEPKLMSASPH